MSPKRSSWGKLAGHRLLAVMLAAAIGLWIAEFRVAGQVAQAADPDATGTTASANDQAVQRGLAYLAGRQHDDGSYGEGAYRGNVAVTAFVGRAMLAAGSKPGAGQYGDRLTKSVDYLLRIAQPNGLIASKEPREHGPMYGHAFALGFLAQCQQVSPRPEVRQKMAKAVELIVTSQNRDGGWRYQPKPLDADLSVTVTQLSALRAARDGGINVPAATIRQAVRLRQEEPELRRRVPLPDPGGHQRLRPIGRRGGRALPCGSPRGAGGPQGTRLPAEVSAQRRDRPAGVVLLLWPLLCGPSHQSCRPADLGSLVPGRPRRLAGATAARRLLARCGVGGSRHGHGLPDAPDQARSAGREVIPLSLRERDG